MHDDIAPGDADNLGVEPVHTAAIDLYGPDLHRDVGCAKPQLGAAASAQGRGAPVFGVDLGNPVAAAAQTAAKPDPIGGLAHPIGLAPCRVGPQQRPVFVAFSRGGVGFPPERGANPLHCLAQERAAPFVHLTRPADDTMRGAGGRKALRPTGRLVAKTEGVTRNFIDRQGTILVRGEQVADTRFDTARSSAHR